MIFRVIDMETFIGCSILLHDDRGRVLIAQRSKKKKAYPLKWETVGGALETGETPEQCIRREVMEELGCSISALKLFQVYVIVEQSRYVLIVYTGHLNETVNPNDEIEQIGWIEKSTIDSYDFYGNEKQKLLDYFKDI